MEKDTFYIHRIFHDIKFYNEEVFLCESTNINGENDTVFVNKDSGKIFDCLKSKFEKRELNVLPFHIPLCAVGYTISETDFIPGPNYTKRAIDVEVIGNSETEDWLM